jgi:hypothetical protein
VGVICAGKGKNWCWEINMYVIGNNTIKSFFKSIWALSSPKHHDRESYHPKVEAWNRPIKAIQTELE